MLRFCFFLASKNYSNCHYKEPDVDLYDEYKLIAMCHYNYIQPYHYANNDRYDESPDKVGFIAEPTAKRGNRGI